jgi:16S rRNA processing protein RimM
LLFFCFFLGTSIPFRGDVSNLRLIAPKRYGRTLKQFILLGHCRKPHGIKGGFSLNLLNPVDSVLQKGISILLKPESGASSLPIEGLEKKILSLSIKNKGIMFLEGIIDRNLVEEIIPFTVSCDRALFPILDENEVYLADLIGSEVVCEKSSEVLGRVVSIGDNGIQDILRIEGVEGEEDFEILFLDQFVHEVDIENKRIVITRPEYC